MWPLHEKFFEENLFNFHVVTYNYKIVIKNPVDKFVVLCYDSTFQWIYHNAFRCTINKHIIHRYIIIIVVKHN